VFVIVRRGEYIVWIIYALLEQNYGSEIKQIYNTIGVINILNQYMEEQGLEVEEHVDNIDETQYDEEIKVLQQKLEELDMLSKSALQGKLH
jgi:protoheme ferro-lyase